MAESMVRRYVRGKKRDLGLLASGEIYVPQSYQWGVEGQVDWYEAYADVEGEREKLQVFAMRSMAGGGSFHYAYRHATQQAFLEAHELAFAYFGGVFRMLRYDNLSSAVKKILRGYQREETARFVAFRSHCGYEAQFCNAAKGNEKGGVEGDVGYSRRNYMVPVPQAKDLVELNPYLLARSQEDEGRKIGGRAQSVGAGTLMEREHLMPLAPEGFELAEVSFPIVDGKACVRARTNWYSTPLRAGTTARVRVLPAWLEVWHEGRCVARHGNYGRGKQILNLEHYLEVLQRKPGALAGSTPLQQWREQGRWPECYDRLWLNPVKRNGKLDGAREMVELLLLGRKIGYGRLEQAVGRTLEMGSSDPAVTRYLMMTEGDERPAKKGGRPTRLEAGELGALEKYERPLPSVQGYDQLLSEVIQ